MAYDRYGRYDPRDNDNNWDREQYGTSGGRDYRSAGDLGGYGRDGQRDYGQRDYGQRDYGQREYGSRDYGQRDYGRSDQGQGGYGQRDYGYQRQGERSGGGWGDRERFTGGSDYYRGDQERGQGNYGRDTYRQSRGTFDRQPQRYGRNEDRGFFERAGDEVRSWFGDEDAERRREQDARHYERGGYGRDENYHSWRNQQISAFDRDYDEYRQENRDRFHNEFSSWRTERQGQRDQLGKVTEHQDVVGSDGGHVGTVDKVRGDRVILTKSDADAGGRHHSIPSRWIASVDDKVTLTRTAADAKREWTDAEQQGAMFGGDRGRDADTGKGTGGTNLNRSFSGTY